MMTIFKRLFPWTLPFLVAAGLGLAGIALGDDDDHERGERSGWYPPMRMGSAPPDVAPATDETYRNECGSCHFPYQPGLLPARSWAVVMNTLGDHFGDNAELAPETAAKLRDYLIANAADQSNHRRSQAIARSIPPNMSPRRITETAFFRNQHHELPPRVVQQNPQVGSFSACQACHTQAATGSYNEHEIRIPGFGGWED